MGITMREEDRVLFPLTTVGRVVQLFRQHLTGEDEADLALLSIVAGAVEDSLTAARSIPQHHFENSNSDAGEESEVAEISNLRLEPPIEVGQIWPLYQKFATLIRGYCDLSLFKVEEFATRDIVKRVSDIVWNTLSKEKIKDRTHLSNLFSYMTDGKLDCFGVAFAVVAGCQVLGFPDVHLAMSEDHAWVVFGKNGTETAEVTWHEKKNDDRRGDHVEEERLLDCWVYAGGRPVICTRNMEVAALVSAISPAISPSLDSLEVGVLQQELLWLLHDLGLLDKYPMALGNLGDLEESSPTLGRPPCTELYDQAIKVDQTVYGNRHVYPYLYSAGYYYRQGDYKRALAGWAGAAGVLRNFRHNKEDEEIYKEFMEINNELIPFVLKTDDSLLSEASCFGWLLQFYDGLCCWEEGSSTPVLHIGWAKPMVKCLLAFEWSARSKLEFHTGDGGPPLPTSLVLGKKPLFLHILKHGQDHVDNNNSMDQHMAACCCAPVKPRAAQKGAQPPFATMNADQLARWAIQTDQSGSQNAVDLLARQAGQRPLSMSQLLGGEPAIPGHACCDDDDDDENDDPLQNHVTDRRREPDSTSTGRVVELFSGKLRGLRDLLVAERMNSSALQLQLTAQQSEVRRIKPQQSQQSDQQQQPSELTPGRVKRLRRD